MLLRFVVLLSTIGFMVGLGTRAHGQDTSVVDTALTPPVLQRPSVELPSWQGVPTVVVWLVDIDVDGRVSQARLVEPATGPENEPIRARTEGYVRGLLFEPARRGGVAVPARIRFQHLLAAPAMPIAPAPVQTAKGNTAAESQEYGAAAAIEAPLQATSSLNLSGTSLRRRPYFNAGDLLNGAPGFYVVQHGGGGKAQQYFLRGFDADHGTDVGLFVDDVPVNMPTHGHGQGYSDLNWIIPEMVETIEVRKGPFFAEFGDYSVAGAVNYRLRTSVPKSFVQATVGRFDTYRGVALAKLSSSESSPLFAAEVYKTNGPFKLDEDYHRVSLMSRGAERLLGGQLTWTLQSFLSAWKASGQIPERAVREKLISRFGNIDPYEGGNSQRHSMVLDYRRRIADGSEFHVNTWVVRNRLDLYSDFGLFSGDQVDGDMIQQVDDRVYSGMRASWLVERKLGDFRVLSRFGTQTRYDLSRPRVSSAPRRIVRSPISAANIDEVMTGLFAELDVRWSRWLRVVGALRYDALLVQVRDRLRDEEASLRSGERLAAIASPKLSTILHAHEYLDLYANFGSGFHSNDARGLVLRGDARVDPFARALAYELGARLGDSSRWQLSWSGFLLDLASETVFVGDDGSTESRGKTRRLGTELTSSLVLLPWLKWDGSVSYSHASFVDNAGNGNSVALAPRWLLQSGIEAEHRSGLSGRLSLLFVGDRPATEDGALTAEGFARLDATVEYRREWWGVQLAVQNLTNAEYKSAQFASTTRLRGETSCSRGSRTSTSASGAFVGCEDITFTPGLPVTVLGTGSLYF